MTSTTRIAAPLAALLLWSSIAVAVNGEEETAPRTDPAATEQILTTTLRKLAHARNEEALGLFRRQDYPAALAGFRAAYDLDPENPEIVNNLAYLYNLLGNPEEAERFYRETLAIDPKRYIAHVNLADLIARPGADQDRLAEAAEHLMRARELKGNVSDVILRQARVAALRGNFDEAVRFYGEYERSGTVSDSVRLEIGDFYRDFGRDEEAVAQYRGITSDPQQTARAAKRIWEIEVDRQARSFGWRPRVEAVSPQSKELATKGRILYNQHRYVRAEKLLAEAIELSPAYAMARADLGDLLDKTGRADEAERAYLQAAAIESGNAEIQARLGRFYLAVDPPRAAEAALFLKRALDLQPEWSALHLPLAEAYQKTGNIAEALRHVNRFLATPLSAPDRQHALSLQAALQERMPDGAMDVPDPDAAPSGATAESLARVRAHLMRGEVDAAMAILKQMPESHRTGEVLNLEARILRAAGRPDEAEAVLRQSLAEDGGQAGALALLGAIRLDAGDVDGARTYLTRARALGDHSAIVPLTRLVVGDSAGGYRTLLSDVPRIADLLRSQRDLVGFLDESSSASDSAQARVLLHSINRRVRNLALAGAAVVLTLVAIVLARVRRRRGGIGLQAFLDRHPDASPEVQSVLSAIRHEVLKHNTMVLSGLIDALAAGEDASEKAAFFSRSLTGEKAAGGGTDGVMDRLAHYVGELTTIARARGARLNLANKTPAIAALSAGFDRLRRVLPDLVRVGEMDRARRVRLAAELREASRLLNDVGYAGVQDLLDRLRSVRIDDGLLPAVFERIRREPAFSHTSFAPLDLAIEADKPCAVMVPRQAFEDILGNLVRNAIESARTAEDAVHIGLRVASESDPITGLERLLVSVRDRSPQKLETETVRSRAAGTGLGLTFELVSRYNGSLEVVGDASPWTKAVVVKLPRAYPSRSMR